MLQFIGFAIIATTIGVVIAVGKSRSAYQKAYKAYFVEQNLHKILIGFYDNKMLVALDDGKDSFEPPRASRPINEAEEMRKVASSIKVVTDFVDIISSN